MTPTQTATAGLITVGDVALAARRRLDPVVYDYIAGAAGDERTAQANETAYQRLRLLPRILRGSDRRDLGSTLLGAPTSMPVLIAPTAFHRLAHSEGERATARAAAVAGTIMIVSMASTVAVEEIAAAAPAAQLWFQLYLQPDLDWTESIVRRAETAGCRALVVTVDSPVHGRRERDLRNGFLDLPAGLCCENLRDPDADPPGTPRPIVMSPELSWAHLDWLRQVTTLPIVLKGVLHPEDARLAVAHGAAAVMVSNHGGRQLDGVPASVEQLPEIVDAVAGRIPVLLDGGVRRGTDVLKALALGAAAVAVGRPVLWGLAVAGQDGVARVLEILRAELDEALALCGCRGLRELSRDLVRS
jgi:4-hydroxymandelate oxidase